MKLNIVSILLAGATGIALGAEEKVGDPMLDKQPMGKMSKLVKPGDTEQNEAKRPLAQIAILLDTSGSMKGLIDQARCQLWNVVSELAGAAKSGTPVKLEIAVYQYGSSLLPASEGFIRKVAGFTSDLDEVSKALFSLSTGGGDEYCAQVIDEALGGLKWSEAPGAYKAVFIAGNESFEQGKVEFGTVLSKALSKNIPINAIYCARPKGVNEMKGWQISASLAEGLFFQIDHNHHLPNMKTPYDSRMRELNRKMNDTFVWYGAKSSKIAQNQKMQDANAAKMSDHAYASRMSAKIGHLYHHADHDLVDALAHKRVTLAEMPQEQMPELMRKMSTAERMDFIKKKSMARDSVRRQMADVISKRHAFLQRNMQQVGAAGKASQSGKMMMLGDALVNAVLSQTKQSGFVFSKNKTASEGGTREISQNVPVAK